MVNVFWVLVEGSGWVKFRYNNVVFNKEMVRWQKKKKIQKVFYFQHVF